MITTRQMEQATAALDAFANTGTRFGKFIQPSAATTTEENQVSGDELESGLETTK